MHTGRPTPTAASDNDTLLRLLQAVQREGSIQQAATALGLSYRHVWGQLKKAEQQQGLALLHWTQGHRALLTPQALAWLQADQLARARHAPHSRALARALQQAAGLVQPRPAPTPTGPEAAPATRATHPPLSIATPADPVVDALLQQAQAQGLHLAAQPLPSALAWAALQTGWVDLAWVHGPEVEDGATAKPSPDANPNPSPTPERLFTLTRPLGLLVAPGNPLGLQALSNLARPGVRCVLPRPGTGTRRVFEAAWRNSHSTSHSTSHGTQPTPWPAHQTEPHNPACAAAVASGLADATLGEATTAAALGLTFVPLGLNSRLSLWAGAGLAHPDLALLLDSWGLQADRLV